jgi:hypothetical protein
MSDSRRTFTLELPLAAQSALIDGARDGEPVKGLTHSFYKYPARFSPAFVRAAIQTFTQPLDLVLDNHVGGGTTLVEALALGRHGVGIDISTLAEFVSTVKTTILEEDDFKQLEDWAERAVNAIHLRKSTIFFPDYAELGYYRHLDHSSRWRIRKSIEQALWSTLRLGSVRLEAFARCVILRTAQWALDGRKNLPSVGQFRTMLLHTATDMIAGARQLGVEVSKHPDAPRIEVLRRSAAGLESDANLINGPKPKLVLTSPPYPGVHVLYHRWQVDGRKEAPLPFLIANKLDGAGSSYYTMGDRKYPGLKTYFDNIRTSMSSIAALADESTTVVQVIAFSDLAWQLDRWNTATSLSAASYSVSIFIAVYSSNLQFSHCSR